MTNQARQLTIASAAPGSAPASAPGSASTTTTPGFASTAFDDTVVLAGEAAALISIPGADLIADPGEFAGPLPTEPDLPILVEPPRIKVPRRHYFRELRRARDHGLDLFDKAAENQDWEHER